METQDGFVVLAKSGVAKGEVPTCPPSITALRSALISNGVLKDSGNEYALVQDYVFSSPSTAAGVVQGRSANGRVDWKTKEGKTLKNLQEAEAV